LTFNMRFQRELVGKTFLIITLAVALYAVAALIIGWNSIRLEFLRFSFGNLLALAGLSLCNYFLRFWRWEIYLRRLSAPLPFRQSLGLYFSSYVMVITPGKIGEAFKAGILREKFGVPLAKGLPIVLAERIYDFLAVLLLAIAGVFFWPGSFAGMTTGLAAAAALPVLLLVFHHRKTRTRLLNKLARAPFLRDHSLALDESMAALGNLLQARQMALSLLITVVAWLGECLGLWLACRGLGARIPVPEAVFVYAAGTLVGSLSFLPGGLGGTEATIIFLLQTLDLSSTSAATVALLVRIFTLWFAVAIGLVFFLFFRRDLLGVSAEPAPATRDTGSTS